MGTSSPQWRHRNEFGPPRRARWRWSRDIREPPGRGRWKTRRRALRGFRKGQNRENRPFSVRDTTTTEQTVIGHLLLVGPPEWRKHFKVASRGGRHNPWWLGGLPNVRLPAHNPLPAEVRSCGPDGPGARLFVPLSDEMASGPRGPARAAARRGHAPSPILSVLPWGCRARGSAGERLLHTQEVAGSNPAAPTLVMSRDIVPTCP